MQCVFNVLVGNVCYQVSFVETESIEVDFNFVGNSLNIVYNTL